MNYQILNDQARDLQRRKPFSSYHLESFLEGRFECGELLANKPVDSF